jgi:deoxyribose-phosphate aldolase
MENLARYIDHTALKPTHKLDEIENLCREALNYGFAAVCLQPVYVKFAHEILNRWDVAVCTVIGFPQGAIHTTNKLFEADIAILNGASELDMVMNVPAFFNENYEQVRHDIETIVNLAHRSKVKVKVIIETCLLTDTQKIEACKIVSDSGADFIKTSSGFSISGATVGDVMLLKQNCGNHVKIKASGGISTADFTIKLIEAGASRIGTTRSLRIMQEFEENSKSNNK